MSYTNLKRALVIITAFACSGLLAACEGGGGSDEVSLPTDRDTKILEALGPGYKLARSENDSLSIMYAVFQAPDGTYQAINVYNYKDGMTAQEIMAVGDVHNNLKKRWDDMGDYTIPGGTDYNGDYISPSGWVSNYMWVYEDPNSNVVFELGNQTSKDLESVTAALQAQDTEQIRNVLVANYGLSEDRAADVASLAQSWQQISKSRTMTSKDMGEFQSKVFGSDLNSIVKAAKKAMNGNSEDYESLVQRAATLNDISPEQARTIIRAFIK